jgi:hypothetical protein
VLFIHSLSCDGLFPSSTELWELSTSSVAVNDWLTLPAFHQYRTDPGPLVTRFHKGTSGGARSDVLDGSVQAVTRSARPISGDSEISPGGGVGAVAPRPGARRWRTATPGRPGLLVTRSVDDLDRNPNISLPLSLGAVRAQDIHLTRAAGAPCEVGRHLTPSETGVRDTSPPLTRCQGHLSPSHAASSGPLAGASVPRQTCPSHCKLVLVDQVIKNLSICTHLGGGLWTVTSESESAASGLSGASQAGSQTLSGASQ